MRPIPSLPLPVFTLLVLLAACRGSDAPAEVVRRDSAGVEIVENPAGAVEAAPRWDVAPEPVVDIGTLEGEQEYELARVRDATVLSDGRVVVAHGDPAELRF